MIVAEHNTAINNAAATFRIAFFIFLVFLFFDYQAVRINAL